MVSDALFNLKMEGRWRNMCSREKNLKIQTRKEKREAEENKKI